MEVKGSLWYQRTFIFKSVRWGSSSQVSGGELTLLCGTDLSWFFVKLSTHLAPTPPHPLTSCQRAFDVQPNTHILFMNQEDRPGVFRLCYLCLLYTGFAIYVIFSCQLPLNVTVLRRCVMLANSLSNSTHRATLWRLDGKGDLWDMKSPQLMETTTELWPYLLIVTLSEFSEGFKICREFWKPRDQANSKFKKLRRQN